MKSRRTTAVALIAGAALFGGLTLSGCTTAATSAAHCGFVVGNGTDDREIHDVIFPGDRVEFDDSKKDAFYVPCNSRNYLINPASGDERGKDLIEAWTADNTKVRVQLSAFWTLNQTEEILKAFYNFGLKYETGGKKFFSTDNNGGGENFATEGWNGMLAENFWPTLRDIAVTAIKGVGDDVWRKNDPVLKKQASDAMSLAFANAIRARIGIDQDMFCGSGNSQWNDEHTVFTCSNVRVLLEVVEPVNEGLRSLDEQQNAERSRLTEEAATFEQKKNLYQQMYGDLWQEVMACEDLERAICVIGSNGGVQVQVQAPQAPAPAPAG